MLQSKMRTATVEADFWEQVGGLLWYLSALIPRVVPQGRNRDRVIAIKNFLLNDASRQLQGNRVGPLRMVWNMQGVESDWLDSNYTMKSNSTIQAMGNLSHSSLEGISIQDSKPLANY